MSGKIKVAITQGDTNGIGYQIILKMLEDQRMADLATIIVYGSAKVAGYYRKLLGLQPVQFQRIDSAADARDGVFNIINEVGEDLKVEPGVPAAEAGMAAVAALEAATADLRQGLVDVLVTCPINKHTVQSENFSFPGHTEYLESVLAPDGADNDGRRALMMLCAGNLRVALATTHAALRDVPEAITEDLLVDCLMRLNASLKKDFALDTPRIAVLALNPHAGEDGLLGDEEQTVIAPAIARVRDKHHILAFGPYAADGFFGAENYDRFDAVLAMYHDQGLAPFKALAMDAGVNFTAGLPYVRTSPDHGTGYDIASKPEASPESLREAVYMAIDVFRNRNI